VRRVPDRKTGFPPFCVNGPEIDVLEPAVRVKLPEFVIVTGPKFVVMRSPLMISVDPVREIPPMAVVLRDPSVAMWALATCLIDAAIMFADVMLFVFVMTSAPSLFPPPPTTPENRRLPVLPRFKLRACVPSTVLLKVMFVPLADVSKEVVPVKLTAEANEIAPPAVKVPARDTRPVSVCVKLPAIEPPPVRVSVPVLSTVRDPPAAVVTLLGRVKLDPVRLMPLAPLVLRVPKAADPAAWEILAAVIALAVFKAPELIVRMPIGTPVPTSASS